MYVTLATIDNAEALLSEEFAGDQISPVLVESLVKRLDGRKHTLVTLNSRPGNMTPK